MSNDVRLEILKLLRLRDEQKRGPIPELDEIARAVGLPSRDVRRACDALESAGHVQGAHGMGGDANPSYFITDRGKAYLYNLEHKPS